MGLKLRRRSFDFDTPDGGLRISLRGELTPERVAALRPLGGLLAALHGQIRTRIMQQRRGPGGQEMGPYMVTGGMWEGFRAVITNKNRGLLGFWGTSLPGNHGRPYKEGQEYPKVKNAVKAAMVQRGAPTAILLPSDGEVQAILDVLAEAYTRAALQGSTVTPSAGRRSGFAAALASRILP